MALKSPSSPWWKDHESRVRLIAEMAASGHWTGRELGAIWGISREAVRLNLNSRASVLAGIAKRKNYLEAAE